MLTDIEQALAGRYRIQSFAPAGCPIFLAAALPLSEMASGLKPRIPSGRGLSSLQARISAGAEALELQATLAPCFDAARIARACDGGLDHVEMTEMASGRKRLVPAQSILLDYAALHGEPSPAETDSTGCAAGETLEDAECAALLEVIERDALATWWYGRHRRQHLSIEIAARRQPRLVWFLDQRRRQTRLIDITTDIGVPVVLAASSEPDGRDIAIGCAAAGQQADAALSAILEMFQTEIAITAGASVENPALEAWRAGVNAQSTAQFQPAVAQDPPSKDLDGSGLPEVLARMTKAGFAPAAIDLTPSGSPLQVVRVVADGTSAMNGRYNAGRIISLAHLSQDAAGCRDEAAFETLEPY